MSLQRTLQWLFLAARLLERISADGRRLRPVEVVEEYDKTIHDELDLLREAGAGG